MPTTKTRKDAPSAPAKVEQQDVSRRPLKTIRVDDVSASIWARERTVRGKVMVFYSVTCERSYRDANGQWRYTKSFDPESLGSLVEAVQRSSDHLRTLAEPELD